jgi:secreted trypsin-like serine protease
MEIIFGVHDSENQYETGKQSHRIESIFIHPDWKPEEESFDADIAIIKLKSSVQLTNFVQPICLWRSDMKLNFQSGVIAAYGSTDESRKVPATPKELEVPILSNGDCFLKNPRLLNLSSSRTFCAGKADGRGPCFGDGGSGLFIKYNEKFYLRGIISASLINSGSCDLSTYSIYTDFFKFHNWIDEVLNGLHQPTANVRGLLISFKISKLRSSFDN